MRLFPALLCFGVGVLASCQSSSTSSSTIASSGTVMASTVSVLPLITVPEARSWADVVEEMRPGVVRVQVTACDGSEAVGSGFVVDGWVVSNRHVIAGYAAITVITSDGNEAVATEVVTSPDEDLALIKVPVGKALPWAVKAPRVADDVAALGFPRGIGFSFTKGSLSALGVEMMDNGRPVTGLLQTDTAVNPGNSGGPLINRQGEVVGVVVLKRTDSEGLAFAIDAARAKAFAERASGDLVVPCQSKATASTVAPATTSVPASTQAEIDEGPSKIVEDFYVAIRKQDFARAWELGGKNLGKNASLEKFSAGYDGTKTTAVKVIDVTGKIVTVQVIAVESGSEGTQVSTYRGTYEVENNEIVRGRLTLESRE